MRGQQQNQAAYVIQYNARAGTQGAGGCGGQQQYGQSQNAAQPAAAAAMAGTFQRPGLSNTYHQKVDSWDENAKSRHKGEDAIGGIVGDL